MNSSPPTVSILMSVYNNDRFLEAAIDSMLRQTFTDFEFLIMDVGSTDRSPEILQAYAAQDPRIRVTIQKNQGLAKSLNQLLAQARGELIARMDADDIALPERLERQVSFLKQHPEILVVGTAFDRIDAKGRFLDHCDPPQTDAEIQTLLIGGTSLLLHPATMLRRSPALAVGGYNETMVGSSDLDLWLRLGEVGQLANLSETLMLYLLHPNSITYRKQVRQTQDAKAACQRAWERRGIQGEFTRGAIDSLVQYEFLLRCGWLGFNRGDRSMAIDYGLKAISSRPRNLQGWKLLACALIKPLPEVQAV